MIFRCEGWESGVVGQKLEVSKKHPVIHLKYFEKRFKKQAFCVNCKANEKRVVRWKDYI